MTLTSQGNGAVDVMVGTNDNKELLMLQGTLMVIENNWCGKRCKFDNSGDIFFDSGDKITKLKRALGIQVLQNLI